jgi:16S rRNA U516 pseudouridylate synthase RsuA-like enzyme
MGHVHTVARDTHGKGIKLSDLLVEFEIATTDSVNKMIRKGVIEVDKEVIKDVKYIIPTGSHMVTQNGHLLMRITIL